MIVYKLTDENGKTYGETQWGPGVTHTATGEGDLCGPGWIHCYTSPFLAVLFNPIHANFPEPMLWEARAEGRSKSDHGIKMGFEKITTTHQIPPPEITITQRVAFGVLCSLEVYHETNYLRWATNWLSGKDRSKAAVLAARYAALAARVAARAARVAAEAARDVAFAAAWAAEAAGGEKLNLIAIAEKACVGDKWEVVRNMEVVETKAKAGK